MDGLFLETHPCPGDARCDAVSMYPLADMDGLLGQIADIDRVVRQVK